MTVTEQLSITDAFARMRAEATAPEAEAPQFNHRPAPSQAQPTGRKPNRYGGKCSRCGGWVDPEAGYLGAKAPGGWEVEHVSCPAPSDDHGPAVDEDGGYFPEITIDPGIYTVETDDGHRTFRVSIQDPEADFAPGATVLAYLAGRDNDHDYTGMGFIKPGPRLVVWKRFREGHSAMVEAAEQLVSDPAKALKSVNCVRCNATLSHPDSVGRNLGPDCAKAWGWS